MRRRGLLHFLRFWVGVVLHIPALVVEAFKRLDLGLSIVVLVVPTSVGAVFGLVAWYVPFAVLLLYGLMWSIYDKFDEIRAANETLQSQITTDQKRVALRDSLGTALKEYRELYYQNPSWDSIEAWGDQLYRKIELALDKGWAEFVISSAGVPPTTTPNETAEQTWLRVRAEQIVKLLHQVDSLHMRPDFNPQE